MLRRFRVQGFKSLLDIDQELPRLAVLAGPNAAGKSNFLDAIQALARLGTERTLGDALAPPIRGFPAELFTLPSDGLPGLLAQKKADLSLEGDLAIAGPRDRIERLKYRVGIEIDPGSGTPTLRDEYLTRLTSQWEFPANEGARIEFEPSGRVTLRQGSPSGHPRYEQPGNHTFVSDPRLSGQRWRALDMVRDEFRLWRTYYLDPATAMREAAPPREVADIGVRGQHIAPFLYGLKAREPKKFAAVRRALRSVIPAVGSLDVDLDTKRGTLDVQIEQDGTTFSSRIVSEGTLRVLALCAIAVTADRGLIAFEEPENGVQPQRLDRIATLLADAAYRGGAQIVVTTHSPYFVAAMFEEARRGENDGSDIGLFSVIRSGRATVIRDLVDPGLLSGGALQELFSDPDEYDKIASLARRGWFDY